MKFLCSLMYTVICSTCFSQINPTVTSWLQNTTVTGSYYLSGNSTPISNGLLVNCQQVSYSANSVYVKATGIPAYAVGPFTGDGNPNQAGNQNAIFKFPLSPTANTGTLTATSGGNIGVFINGVAMFDFRDGVAWNTTSGTLCGGPGRTPCPGGPGTTQAWNRDAIPAEKPGFDCSKGHPAGTNYHHHQNPSAFKLDIVVISTICNLYDADGLYTINTTQHSPLIGFAYDGFPVYGAYGYANANGTGGIARIKSGYQLRNITVRTNHADGTDVADGPPVSTTYPLGYFREDYEWVAHPTDESYLDVHNGRFCVTPEYPAGKYCYFATVDANHNSFYPYLVGPTYYGNKTAVKVTSITEPVTIYNPSLVPLQLLHFSVVMQNKNALLKWQTDNEINTSYFTIERSIDGNQFYSIGNVYTNNALQYQFKDEHTPKGNVYYRLKQFDKDGTFKYFHIVKVQNTGLQLVQFKVFPNPAADIIAIQADGLITNDAEVLLLDNTGKIVQQTNIYKGQTIAYFSSETLYAGIYIVKIKSAETNETHKIIVKK